MTRCMFLLILLVVVSGCGQKGTWECSNRRCPYPASDRINPDRYCPSRQRLSSVPKLWTARPFSCGCWDSVRTITAVVRSGVTYRILGSLRALEAGEHCHHVEHAKSRI